MTPKPEYIFRKHPFKKRTKCEGVIDYKIIRRIHREIQAKKSTIQSEPGGGKYGLLIMEIQPATYQTVNGYDFQRPYHPPKEAPVPANSTAAEVPSYICHHASQLDQWGQMVNAKDIMKQQLLESLDEKYFKGQCQVNINYANRTLAGIIHHFYDDNGTIPPTDI